MFSFSRLWTNLMIVRKLFLQKCKQKGNRGITYQSDHYMVRGRIMSPFKINSQRKDNSKNVEEAKQIEVNRYVLDSLIPDSTRTLFQQRLYQKRHLSESLSLPDMCRIIVNSLHSVVEPSLLQTRLMLWPHSAALFTDQHAL